MTLDEIGAFLVSNVTGTTLILGDNLFLGRLPDAPDVCVALFETGGALPDQVMGGGNQAVIERPRIQIVTRSTGYSAGRTLAGAVWSAMELVADEAISGVRYLRISAVQSPFPLERDSLDRILFVQNFDVLKTP